MTFCHFYGHSSRERTGNDYTFMFKTEIAAKVTYCKLKPSGHPVDNQCMFHLKHGFCFGLIVTQIFVQVTLAMDFA